MMNWIADEINSLKKTLGEDVTEDVVTKGTCNRGCELSVYRRKQPRTCQKRQGIVRKDKG